jgi:probable HAF family extracellular repeat protein
MGQIVGFYQNASGTHGFFLSGGIYTTLDDPLATGFTEALGINDAGQVGTYAAGSFHGFLHLNGNGLYVTIDDPLAGSLGTVATGINDAGQIVGYYLDSSNSSHGFLYSGGNYTPLDDLLAANGTIATGINAAGQIVGYYFDASNHPHASSIPAVITTPPSTIP